MSRKPEKPAQYGFYAELLVRTIRDSATLCNLRSSFVERDVVTVHDRVRVEGLSFLTKALPTLGKCLDKALASGCPLPKEHTFKLSSCEPRLPIFLGAFWKLVFNTDGELRVTSDSCETFRCEVAVRAIRQICFLLYKLEGVTDELAAQAVIDKFVETDRSLPGEDEKETLSSSTLEALDKARTLISYVLRRLDPLDILPGHGPGSVATGEKPWEKMNFSRFYVKLDEVYSYPEYFFYNYTHLVDDLDTLERLEEVEAGTAKVVLVPKDSRGPRLISMEPLEYQWIQQGLMRELVREIERPHSLTAGYVNFTYQTVNQELALASSGNDSRYVTLDLEEASDRVSLWLVKKLFPEHIFECLKACRSEFTELPDGHCLRLKKFAPMGSSCCFPVEALIFWALAVGSQLDSIPLGMRLSALPEVWVYGDDIIATRSGYELFRPVFEELHLKFNRDKCCTGRFFRESCGVDAFNFENVTPFRVKTPWVVPRKGKKLSPATALSYVAYVNALRERGLLTAANLLQCELEKAFGNIPVTNDPHRTFFAFRREDWDDPQVEHYLVSTFRTRFNKRYQRREVRVPVPEPVYLRTGSPNWSELLRLHNQIGSSCRSVLESSSNSDPCRYAVPHQLKMRWRWIAVEQLITRS
jgi:hypothetical protein